MDKIAKHEQDHEEPNVESYTKEVYNSHSPREKESNSDCKLRRRSSRVNTTSQRNHKTNKDARSPSRSRSPCIRNSKKGISSNPFINFVQHVREKHSGMRSSTIHQIAGEKWRSMSFTEKQPYIQAALNIKNQKLNQKKESINDPAEINGEQPKKEDQAMHEEKSGKREGKKREPKRSTRKKRKRTKSNTESDTDSISSATSLTNTSDDASDTS